MLCCSWSLGRMPCPNHEAVEFQPRTVDNSALDSGCPARILSAWWDEVNPHFNDKGRMNGYIGNDNREQNKRIIDTRGSNSQWMGRSYLPFDRGDRVLFRTARRNYYPAAWELVTAREPKHLIFPAESSQAFETAVLNRWLQAYAILKYFIQTTSPRWDIGLLLGNFSNTQIW